MTTRLLRRAGTFWKDDAGFLISAELVIIATLLVIGLVVGLVEVQNAVVSELNDVGEAIGSLNQSYYFHGHRSIGGGWFGGRLKSFTAGSAFVDRTDAGDLNQCSISCIGPTPEVPKLGVGVPGIGVGGFGGGFGGGFIGGFGGGVGAFGVTGFWIDGALFWGANGSVIGRFVGGSVYGLDGTLIGRVAGTSFLSAAGAVIGRIEGGCVLGVESNLIGWVGGAGLFDDAGQLIGRIVGSSVFGLDGALIGRFAGGLFYGPADDVIGRVSDGVICRPDGSHIGRIQPVPPIEDGAAAEPGIHAPGPPAPPKLDAPKPPEPLKP